MPVYGGEVGIKTNRALARWMDDEGMADDFLRGIDWDSFDMAKVDQETWDHMERLMERFFLNHTKEELYNKGLSLGAMIYPVSTPKDIAESPQLEARKYWEQVEHPELGEIISYPGAAVKASLMPMGIRRRAPLIGEHNQEVYRELGFSEEELTALKQGGII
jgi:crotonobetainyl-CoA:carnitine CoA-transferase CaiB-like acyl-CoA transferase